MPTDPDRPTHLGLLLVVRPEARPRADVGGDGLELVQAEVHQSEQRRGAEARVAGGEGVARGQQVAAVPREQAGLT